MKKGKKIETVFIIIGVIFLVYMLITGRAVLTTKGYIVVFVVLPISLLVGIINVTRDRLQGKTARNTGGSADREAVGSVKTSMGFYWFIVIFMIVIWVFIGFMTMLSFQLGVFQEDSSAIVPLAVIWGILIVLTLLIGALVISFGKDVYYDAQGITLKGFGPKKEFSWQELGEVKSCGVLMVFYNSGGKKLFRVNTNCPGYDDFWKYYQNQMIK